MGQSKKKKKQQRRDQPKREIPNQEILDSIGSPNAWTPKAEDEWLNELHKISAGEIYRRFPPMKKPMNVRKHGSGSGDGLGNRNV